MTSVEGGGPLLIEVHELDRLEGPVWFVDTRKRPDYDRGHIPGAIHFDNFNYANEDTTPLGLARVAADWGDMFRGVGIGLKETFVFYDVGMENRSPRPGVMLRWFGNPRSYVLHGGFAAWVAAGKPVSQSPPPAKTPYLLSEFAAGLATDDIRTVDDVAEALDGRAVLLDVRDDIEYLGHKRMQKNPRLGRIPDARHVNWNRFCIPLKDVPDIVGRGKYKEFILSAFKDDAGIREEMAAVGIRPSDEVIVYCQKSHRASTAYLALKKAGFEKARVYLGSFREWSRRRDLPVEQPHTYVST